jgi:hypothetical protein
MQGKTKKYIFLPITDEKGQKFAESVLEIRQKEWKMFLET